MRATRALLVGLIIFLAGCTTQVNNSSTSSQQQTPAQDQPIVNQDTTQQPGGQGTLQGEVIPPAQTQAPTTQEFNIDADDYGFYMAGSKISSISVSKDNMVKITYQVRTSNVYYGGLDFRGDGWGDTGKVLPGGVKTVEFTAENTFDFSSYWPSTSKLKATGTVNVM